MSWQAAYGLTVFATVYALVHAAKLFKRDDADDTVSASMKNMFKLFFISTALILSIVSVGNMNHVIQGTIDSDTGLNNNAELDETRAGINSIYSTGIKVFVAYVTLMLLFVLYMIIRAFPKNARGDTNERGGGL